GTPTGRAASSGPQAKAARQKPRASRRRCSPGWTSGRARRVPTGGIPVSASRNRPNNHRREIRLSGADRGEKSFASVSRNSPVVSPFDVLRIDPDADDEAIRRAYRERVFESHPDHGGTARQFRRVRTAYERLKAGDGSEREPGVVEESVEDDRPDEIGRAHV